MVDVMTLSRGFSLAWMDLFHIPAAKETNKVCGTPRSPVLSYLHEAFGRWHRYLPKRVTWKSVTKLFVATIKLPNNAMTDAHQAAGERGCGE